MSECHVVEYCIVEGNPTTLQFPTNHEEIHTGKVHLHYIGNSTNPPPLYLALWTRVLVRTRELNNLQSNINNNCIPIPVITNISLSLNQLL